MKPFAPITRGQFKDLVNKSMPSKENERDYVYRSELNIAYSQALDAIREAELERDALMFEIQRLSDLCPEHRGAWNGLRMAAAGVLCPWLGPIFKSIARLMAVGNRIKDK